MTDEIAVTIDRAAELVPFSPDYIRKAIKRTGNNTLPARLAGRKYVINVEDLREWSRHEGVAA